MNSSLFFNRSLASALLCTLLFGLAGPSGLVPEAEAAKSRDKKKISKLKKTVKKLKRQLGVQQIIRIPVPAAAPTPAPFIEMVTVGNVGNATDAGNASEASVYGAVAEAFQIGKYEVTNAQYAAFLNAVAAEDPNGVFNANMESAARGGIQQFGTSPNFSYAAKAGMGDKPVNYVSFWDACRFCNWLHNGRPTGPQGAATTEFGAYDLTVQQKIDDNEVEQSPGAKFFVPSEDQWYKAAYHQPESAGGDSDDYWLYATGSNDVPTVGTVNAIGEIANDDGNIANYSSGADWDSNDDGSVEDGNVTSVGSGGPGSASAYGANDMAGNVWEWNETMIFGSFRGLRGGSWFFLEDSLRSSLRSSSGPDNGDFNLGFRIASP